jgi:hypothetical protein
MRAVAVADGALKAAEIAANGNQAPDDPSLIALSYGRRPQRRA